MNYASLATRYAGRPLLLTPQAAHDLAARIRVIDPRAFARPGRIDAFMRRIGMSGGDREVMAFDDYDLPPPVPLEEQLAYTPRWMGQPEDLGFCWSLSQGVALMCADTPLVERGTEFCGEVYHGYDTLLQGMREASADDRVRGIFLKLDTPGGVVADGLRVVSDFMLSARAEAGGKPIWVYADMACSAGYWIASQADRIVSPGVGYVGSIGAVIVHESQEGFLKEVGLEITSLEFPDGGEKTDGAWWKALSPRARETLLSDVAQCGRNFIATVEAGRPSLTEEALLATRAGVFMAQHDDAERSGQALGFVDAIGGEEDTFLELVEHVSQSSSGSRTSTAPAASGSAASTTPKEATMGNLTPQKRAALAAEQRKLEARLITIKAQTGEGPAAEGGGEDTQSDDTTSGDDDADALGGAPGADALGEEADDEDEDDQPEASAIAASAEAKAHPGLALAAIQSGQTLAQFKASVAALAGGGKVQSRLDRAMNGARRLGPDAARSESGKSPYSSAMAARAEKNRAHTG